MWRLERDRAHAPVAVAHVQLCALARGVAQMLEGVAGGIRERERVGGGVTQRDEAKAQSESTFVVAPHQAMRFEGGREAVSRRPRDSGGIDERVEVARPAFEGSEDGSGLVEDPHAA